ncbi:MAG: membrane protein insertion efficiency factor YidD [Pseudomonadota bacterium]
MKPVTWLFCLPIRAYRLIGSPWVGQFCRFQPTCSAYALEALEAHGPIKGSWLAIRRLARCHPLGGHGHDPVPPKESAKTCGNSQCDH